MPAFYQSDKVLQEQIQALQQKLSALTRKGDLKGEEWKAIQELLDAIQESQDILRRQYRELTERLSQEERGEPEAFRAVAVEGEALRQAKELEIIFNAISDAVIVYDKQGTPIRYNPAAIQVLGLDPGTSSQAAAAFQLQIYYPDGSLVDVGDLPSRQALSGQGVYGKRLLVKNDAGQEIQILASGNPLRDEAGQVIGALTIFHDITQLEEAERALRESEERFRALADNIAQFAWMADEKGWIFWYNRRWFDYTGTTLPEVEGWGWQKVHHPDHVQGVVEKIRHCFQTGEVWEDTFPLRGRDGNYRWFLSRAVPIRDEEGKVTRWFGTNTDVTEQRNVEQALRESEARLRTLVESNVIGVIFSRENGTITDANEAFLKIVGYSRQELEAGQVNWIDLTPEEYLYLDAHGIAEAKERGACTPYEKEYLRKDGTRVPVLIGYAPLENPPDEYVAFTLDLTDLKQAEATIKQYADQLERSNRDLEDFAFVASHDLQEPLRKIQGFSKLLQGQLGDQLDETSLDYLERMQDAANRMNRMTEALLNYSRVSTKAQPFTMVDLNHVIREVLSDLEFRVEQSDGSVKVGELPTIEADPVQMRQLLQNLIGNALKFHKKDTPPCVQVRAEIIGKAPGGRRMVRLEVQDNGIGINPDFTERIFQPFQRLHGRSEYEGSGMGLAICRKIVERHAGTISVQSAPEGGSLFVATLPLRQKGRLT